MTVVCGFDDLTSDAGRAFTVSAIAAVANFLFCTFVSFADDGALACEDLQTDIIRLPSVILQLFRL
jgi:Cu2+-containing amine oxidase